VKLLVVLARPPHPEGGAADRTAVGLLRGLLANGVEVAAVAARPPSWAFGDSPADLPVDVVDVPEGDDWRTRLARLRRPLGSLGRSAFGAHVRAAAAAADAVHLETIDTLWCDAGVAKPSALHLHYLARQDRSPWRPPFATNAEYVLAERVALRRYRHLVASSARVAAELRARAASAEVTLAPLTLDPARYEPAPLDGSDVGILGTAAWAPTARAVRRLETDVWPRVAAEVPEARLRVAGRGYAPVESAAEFLRSLALLLYPLDRGTGTKVKVLEALAVGLPVVTTPAGAEGLAPSEGLIVETESSRLAGAAVRLLRDPAERRRRGIAAQETFRRDHEPAVATAPLVELYRRLTSTPAQSVNSSR
jgi:glycosyltransferase involved in cell wall biosynthesis